MRAPRSFSSFRVESVSGKRRVFRNPGPMEYRGVYLLTGQEVFHFGPVYGTNNIGEFLAIVHALALMKQNKIPTEIFRIIKAHLIGYF